jgi:CheY-like chemotaxis protein
MNSSLGRVLIAEDNLAFSNVMRFALEKVGLLVTVVGDGEQALEQLKSQDFALLITDEQMPRLSGRALCRRLREDDAFKDLPIFFCTAKGWELSADDLKRDLGVVGVFHKPFSPLQMAEVIASFRCQLCPTGLRSVGLVTTSVGPADDRNDCIERAT